MKRILFIIAIVFLLVAASLLGYGFLIEPNRLVVNEYEIGLKDWDKNLDGFKVVMISDIHGGSSFIGEEKIKTVVQKANEQNADLIVLLGDYVTQNSFDRTKIKMPMDRIADSLQGLKAKYGVYAVLGNHDAWYDNYDNDDNDDNGVIKREIERAGYPVLDDKVTLIQTGKGAFWLAGFKDILPFGSRRAYSDYAKNVLKGIDTSGDAPGKKIIALTHNPDAAMMITDNREGQYKVSDDIVLLLTGHTHGGQVRFPYFGAPIVPSSFGYTQGHIVESGLDMFVTTGIGTSILPVRFGVPPEIAVLTIHSQ
jgi:predicted MPP superfamily phosphohydrolase